MKYGYIINIILVLIAIDIFHLFLVTSNTLLFIASISTLFLATIKYDNTTVKYIVSAIISLEISFILAYYITLIPSLSVSAILMYINTKKRIKKIYFPAIFIILIAFSIVILFATFYYWYLVPLVSYPLLTHNINYILKEYNATYNSNVLMIMNPIKHDVVCRDIARMVYFQLLKDGKHPKYVMLLSIPVEGKFSIYDLLFFRIISKNDWHTFVIDDKRIYDFYITDNNKIVLFNTSIRNAKSIYPDNYSFCIYHVLYIDCKLVKDV